MPTGRVAVAGLLAAACVAGAACRDGGERSAGGVPARNPAPLVDSPVSPSESGSSAAARGGSPAAPPGTQTGAAPAVRDTFGPVEAPGRAPPPVAELRAVRVGAHEGYDRIVFEFAGDRLPGYRVVYDPDPARECGSGAPVDVPGSARLHVRLRPARAHDDRGRPTVSDRDRRPELSAVRALRVLCDFEAEVEWAIGLAARVPFRVLELDAPPRLVIDVRHAP